MNISWEYLILGNSFYTTWPGVCETSGSGQLGVGSGHADKTLRKTGKDEEAPTKNQILKKLPYAFVRVTPIVRSLVVYTCTYTSYDLQDYCSKALGKRSYR